MYVDSLDLSTVKFPELGGPPPSHKFAVSAWTYDAVKVVLAADRKSDTTYGKLQVSFSFPFFVWQCEVECNFFYSSKVFGSVGHGKFVYSSHQIENCSTFFIVFS